MSVLVDLKNRGVTDVFFLVCDGLKGLPAVVESVWPLTTVQTCIIRPVDGRCGALHRGSTRRRP